MTARTPRAEYLAPSDIDLTSVREIRVSESGEPILVEDGRVLVGMWDIDQSTWRLLIEGVAIRSAYQRAAALNDRWRTEGEARGAADTLMTDGVVGMLDHALKVEAPQPVMPYTTKIEHGRIWASCVCGETKDWPDKGMGRANHGAWKTQHQDCEAKA